MAFRIQGVQRSRWAAFGAAVAVTLGGGGVFIANAAPSSPSSLVTIDPVRVIDTRDSVDLGLAGPFTSPVSQKFTIVGSTVPVGATGVLLNATVVGPTAAGFLSVRPGDASGVARTSSLNFVANQTLANSVQVALPTTGPNAGQIDLTYDALGVAGPTTDVLIDVVGYMIPAAGGASPELESRVGALESQLALLGTNQPVVEFASALDELVLPQATVSPAPALVVSPASQQLSVTVNAPRAGKVAVVAHATAKGAVTNGRLVCQVTNDTAATTIDAGTQVVGIASPATSPSQPTLGTNRVFAVTAGPNTFDLMCAATDGNVTIHYRSMSATFTPNP